MDIKSQVSNLVNTKKSNPSVQLLEPRFLSVATNITVREGSLAELPCSVLNLGTKQVTWQRVGEDFFTTIGRLTWVKKDNIMIGYNQKTPEISDWNLLIKNVKPEDAGLYECQITATEIMKRTVQLNVIGISVKGKEYVEHGDSIVLECNATGGPHIPEDIDWFKNGDKIDSHKYHNIIVTKFRSLENRALISRLIIDRSTKEDTGTYICRSSLDEINKKTVTVLVADSSNVKREPGRSKSGSSRTHRHPEQS
ncbi:hypothetical protein LOTGIDRAFT_165912 [Lottia gigantea]|uniref:Ig-like domain-containing protein n=1 Tax=Lottia gigantea TaxID=225164 RepID=V4BHI7_LOTGI|nr:hypothetical protein LOTGIDRAFT_165912 [Lottia gigantea]ESO88169.1 hypothetical protein LOTGIDRAFT_165912 [Lottia gigantea]